MVLRINTRKIACKPFVKTLVSLFFFSVVFPLFFFFSCALLELAAKLKSVISWHLLGSPVRHPADPVLHARKTFALDARGSSSHKVDCKLLPPYLFRRIQSVRIGRSMWDLSICPDRYRDSSAWVSPTLFSSFSEAASDPALMGGRHGSASPHRSTVRPELPGCLKPASSWRW